MKKERRDPVKELANKLIEQMKTNTAPWQRPWVNSLTAEPHNALTKKPYRGFNNLALSASGFEDPRWLTFKQAKDLGYSVKKGSNGTPLTFYSKLTERARRDDNGNVIKDIEGKTVKDHVSNGRIIMNTFFVFNAAQIDGMPPLERTEPNIIEVNARAEALLLASGANITHEDSNKAYYAPFKDRIFLPEKGQFKSAEHYYSTALHELGHWTGHGSRLNREIINMFGTEDYAREELRAEISSMLVGQELGIRHDPSQHVAYTQSWIKILEDQPNEILHAVRDAQKIFDFVMQYDREYINKNDMTNDIEQAKPQELEEEELER